jgi:hypothetical protein
VLPSPNRLTSVSFADASLLALGARLQSEWGEYRRLLSKWGYDVSPAVQAKFDALDGRVDQLLIGIEATAATTFDGLAVKALAVSWCHRGETTIELTTELPTTDVRLCEAILRDLLAGDAARAMP